MKLHTKTVSFQLILKNICLCSSALFGVTVLAAEKLNAGGHSIAQVIQYHGKHCMELKDYDGFSVAVFQAGDYCVTQNLNQTEPMFHLPHQPGPKGPLIGIHHSSNVSVDLMGRHLLAKIPSGAGILVNDGGQEPPHHNIKISNGHISTSKQPALFMVHAGNRKNKRFYSELLGEKTQSVAGALADYGGDISQYGATEYILENLTLETEGRAIIMQGRKNIIRNCKLIGGNGAVNIYGPNLIFENNEIILNAKAPNNSSDELPVALYLEDAADSVVRNNRFVIKGGVANADAVVLKNSPNVALENNIIIGVKEMYKLLDEKSNVNSAGNILR